MVKMAMGIDNITAAEFVLGERDEYPIGITPRVDNDCFSCSLTTQDVTIGLNGPDNQCSKDQNFTIPDIIMNSLNLIMEYIDVKGGFLEVSLISGISLVQS
jgi:hypothetical protein